MRTEEKGREKPGGGRRGSSDQEVTMEVPGMQVRRKGGRGEELQAASGSFFFRVDTSSLKQLVNSDVRVAQLQAVSRVFFLLFFLKHSLPGGLTSDSQRRN